MYSHSLSFFTARVYVGPKLLSSIELRRLYHRDTFRQRLRSRHWINYWPTPMRGCARWCIEESERRGKEVNRRDAESREEGNREIRQTRERGRDFLTADEGAIDADGEGRRVNRKCDPDAVGNRKAAWRSASRRIPKCRGLTGWPLFGVPQK